MTNFTPRTYQQIQAEFYRALASSKSTLTDVAPGSVLYTLSRSIAVTHLEQELLLDGMADSFYLSTAGGIDLDRIASDYGLARKPGAPASGYILVTITDSDFQLQPGQTFTDPVTEVQLQYNGLNPIPISFLIESRVPVTATITGPETNLLEGTDLLFPLNVKIDAVVGSHRTPAGQACGSLSGGRSEESDLEFRIRIADSILNRRGTTQSAIRNVLLSNEVVDWVHLETPLPGFIQAWIDYPIPLTLVQLQTLKELAETAKPAGCVLSVQQLVRQTVDIHLKVRINRTADQDTVSANLANTCQTYVYGLSLESPFQLLDLLNLLQRLPDILYIEIINPEIDLEGETDSVFRIGDFTISYELQ